MTSAIDIDVERYIERIGGPQPSVTDLSTLTELQRAHMIAVPFENLDIVFGDGVGHDRGAAFDKIMRGRGGWCFELNGAFGLLLEALGFDVRLIGAAVLLDGPSTVLEHLALEVGAGGGEIEPHLVDVGFGESFTSPLALNRRGEQDGGDGTYEFIASPQGTTLAKVVDGIPEARLRFKRVAHDFDDFRPVATSMQIDPAKNWHRKPFATRLLSAGGDRVTLTHDTLTIRIGAQIDKRPVQRSEWDALLAEWFGIERPGPWPT